MTERSLTAPLRWAAPLLAVLFALGCTASPPTPSPPEALRLITHDSFAISDEVMAEFQRQHGVPVEVLKAGDGGAMVNQAILTRDSPLAHVLFGVDNTFLTRALEAQIFTPYRSPLLEQVRPELVLDGQHRVSPIDYGDVCLNIDRQAFTDTPAPVRLEDLTEPAFRGMLVVQNPATSTPGLAFLLATVARFGEDGEYTWRDYWADLRENDVLVTSGWEEAYNGVFSAGAGEGDRPIVVSYATSPAAEVLFADPPTDVAPTVALMDGCFRQIEFAGILRGTEHEAAAQRVVDWMLSLQFQEDIPLNMFVFPANSEADLPAAFDEHAAAVDEPVQMEPAVIDAGRERWIEEWTDVVLR